MKKFAKGLLIIGTGLPSWVIWYKRRALKKQQSTKQEEIRHKESVAAQGAGKVAGPLR